MTTARIVINPRPKSQTFLTARFDSECDKCDKAIRTGDLMLHVFKGGNLCQECGTK